MEKKPKILIVDDTPLMAKITQKTVESFGYETEIRENSTRAISFVGNNDVDVILMDIELNNSTYDGISTCKVIKSKYHIPIIFITGHESAKIFQDLTCGFDVLIKPYDEKMLKMHIDIALMNAKIEKHYRDAEMWLDVFLAKNKTPVFLTNLDCLLFRANDAATMKYNLTCSASNVKSIFSLFSFYDAQNNLITEMEKLIELSAYEQKIFLEYEGKRNEVKLKIEKTVKNAKLGGYEVEIEKVEEIHIDL